MQRNPSSRRPPVQRPVMPAARKAAPRPQVRAAKVAKQVRRHQGR